MTHRIIVIASTVLFTTASGGVTRAHHAAQTEFDLTTNILMTAVLVKYEALNPHSYMTVTVTNANGAVEEWKLECLAVRGMQQKGISARDNLKPGVPYKIVYSPARNGTKLGFLTSIVLQDGTFVAFGPDANVEAARALSK